MRKQSSGLNIATAVAVDSQLHAIERARFSPDPAPFARFCPIALMTLRESSMNLDF
jgi:hypothetical protein